MTTPTTGITWFSLSLDEEARLTTSEAAGEGVGEIVRVERARGDCCGCCGPIRGSTVVFGTRLQAGRVVGGLVAFLGGIVAAVVLSVLVLGLESYGAADAAATGTLTVVPPVAAAGDAVGTIDLASGEFGSG